MVSQRLAKTRPAVLLFRHVDLELLRRILATANRSLVWRQSSALAGVRHDRCGFSRPKRKVSDRRKGGGREGPDYMIFPNPLADTFNARRRKLCGNQRAA